MSTLPPKTLSEQLLRLKAALEDGKGVDAPKFQKTQTEYEKLNQKQVDVKKTFKIKANTLGTPDAKKETTDFLKTTVEEESKKTQQHNMKSIPLNKNERVIKALQWLYSTFPNAFKREDKIPLKIGVLHDLFAALEEEGSPSKKSIRDAVTLYTGSVYYQKAILANDKRYDLNGVEVGVVEEKQKEYADQRHVLITTAIESQVKKRQEFRERRRKNETKLNNDIKLTKD